SGRPPRRAGVDGRGWPSCLRRRLTSCGYPKERVPARTDLNHPRSTAVTASDANPLTWPNPFWASLQSRSVALELQEGVLLAANHGGDSDSTGSIAGNLLGLLHSRSGSRAGTTGVRSGPLPVSAAHMFSGEPPRRETRTVQRLVGGSSPTG